MPSAMGATPQAKRYAQQRHTACAYYFIRAAVGCRSQLCVTTSFPARRLRSTSLLRSHIIVAFSPGGVSMRRIAWAVVCSYRRGSGAAIE